jgi:hypothetical protein
MIHVATSMQAGNEHLNLMSVRGEKTTYRVHYNRLFKIVELDDF